MSTEQVDVELTDAKVPTATPVPPEEPAGDQHDEGAAVLNHGPSPWRQRMRGAAACTISTIFHAVALVVLSLFMLVIPAKQEPPTIVASPIDSPKDEELEEIELDPELSPSTEMTSAVSSAPLAGVTGAVAGAMVATTQLDTKVVEKFAKVDNNFNIEHPLDGSPAPKQLVSEVPVGFKGEPRMIIDDYNQAFDQITQEIRWMLDRSDVLVIWCFDQSGSMKDDQKEVKDRVQKVYHELGLTKRVDDSRHLTTAVASYGGGYMVHTPRPTSDYREIRKAIEDVPEDPSGREVMCEAVGKTIRHFRSHAKGRQMALILVTDESGEPDNNLQYLEATLAEAKSAQCKVYTLGREAVFGYPYARFRYKHPQTGRTHWLTVDRGPESAFVEQLQTNGFHRRHDAFGSGFGPYEQTRLARETGGIFFMLPSVESNLVRGQKRRYELEILRPYKPDLRARIEVLADRDKYPLRTFLWMVINDLNPYNKKAGRSVEMRMEFSLAPQQFVQQARKEQVKAIQFIGYLGEVQKILENDAAKHRDQEPVPRWQANYDLIYAQTVAYQARLYEYGVALEQFMQKPEVWPLTKSPNLTLTHWDAVGAKIIRVPEKSQPYIDRATELFNDVIRNHPDTPWAERAKWELSRGFGIRIAPDYDPPYRKVSNPSPLPKL